MGDFDFKSTSFELKGFKHLYQAINGLPEVVKKAELEPILVRGLEPMRAFAATLAPDDPKTSAPYDLATSISVSTRQRSGRARRDRALGQYDARAFMGPTKFGYPEAMFAEFGTGQRFWQPPGATKSTGVMRAWPYMRPAYDSQKTVALKIISDNLAERLQMIAKKYAIRG